MRVADYSSRVRWDAAGAFWMGQYRGCGDGGQAGVRAPFAGLGEPVGAGSGGLGGSGKASPAALTAQYRRQLRLGDIQ